MLFGFSSLDVHYNNDAPTGWLAGKALLTRAGWSQPSETEYHHEKSGKTVQINEGTPLRQVVHMIVDLEYGTALANNKGLSAAKRQELLALAHHSADAVLDRKVPRHSVSRNVAVQPLRAPQSAGEA
ncbi:MAG: hypothetical protein H0X25_09560 [Acidobacteriales bacterium]|nr:hypothetical protein [Terriglobales bacterium]